MMADDSASAAPHADGPPPGNGSDAVPPSTDPKSDAMARATVGGDAGPGGTPNTVEQTVIAAFEADLAEARRMADENWDRYLRAEAELDNARKRSDRLRHEALTRQRRDLLARFLEVADNLERALDYADADPGALKAGLEGTYRAIVRLLEREGVQRIDADEAAFDPNLHEAVGVVTVPGIEDERVVSVEQAGYTLEGDLLRAARVIVGRPPEV